MLTYVYKIYAKRKKNDDQMLSAILTFFRLSFFLQSSYSLQILNIRNIHYFTRSLTTRELGLFAEFLSLEERFSAGDSAELYLLEHGRVTSHL